MRVNNQTFSLCADVLFDEWVSSDPAVITITMVTASLRTLISFKVRMKKKSLFFTRRYEIKTSVHVSEVQLPITDICTPRLRYVKTVCLSWICSVLWNTFLQICLTSMTEPWATCSHRRESSSYRQTAEGCRCFYIQLGFLDLNSSSLLNFTSQLCEWASVHAARRS